jgi:hypothetical protein
VAVSLKRLAAPRWVLSFLLGFEALRGIAKPFLLLRIPAQTVKSDELSKMSDLQTHL